MTSKDEAMTDFSLLRGTFHDNDSRIGNLFVCSRTHDTVSSVADRVQRGRFRFNWTRTRARIGKRI